MKLRSLALPLVWGVLVALTPVTALGRPEGSIQKTWDYPEGIATLVVDTDAQDVVLKAGGPGVSGRLVGDNGDEVKTVKEGDTLTLTVRTDRSWFSWRKKTSRVELSVPNTLELRITTASGAVLAQTGSRVLQIRSASGDIEAARGGAAADVDSTSGTIRLKGFTGPVKAVAISGDLVLEDLSGDIQAATMSGNLKGSGLSPGDKSRFTTVSGSADLWLRGGIDGYTIRSETVSGEVRVGEESGNRELTVGKTGPVIVVKSVSGDVRVQ